MIEEFVRTPPRSCGKCYYFRTISHPIFKEIRKYFFKGRKRRLSRRFLEKHMSPFVAAIWIMDDGSRDRNQLRINSQCFTKKDNMTLQDILRAKLGIVTTLNQDKNRYRIRVKSESMNRLVRIITPFIIPSMLYKLPL